jgi:16S rRNA (adenine1518-N6/adenine1519-N6)-dimethyltransferase
MPRYDQHFLRDEQLARLIADAAQPLPDETLLEIGPGLGILSQYLLSKTPAFIGIEIDPRCYERLLKAFPQGQWLLGDALKVPWPEGPLYLVSNLPYSISGPILFRILEARTRIRGGLLMLQKEVAQRLYAQSGERTYSRPSVLFQAVYRVERLRLVRPGSFSPPPKVLSEIIRWTRSPQIPLSEWPRFAQFIRAAFRQPRQTLGRNLRTANLPCHPAYTARRPHEIPLLEFITLWQWSLAPSES